MLLIFEIYYACYYDANQEEKLLFKSQIQKDRQLKSPMNIHI